jgi:hypothetical protein
MLVLKEFRLDENADEFLYIKGREEGLWAFILSWIGIDATTELRCEKKSLVFKTASLRKGQEDISVPISAVTAVVTGFHKPFKLLVAAVMFLLGGIFGAMGGGRGGSVGVLVICLLAAAVCFALYYMRKSMLFGVFNGGDHPIAALHIKRSVIEGVSVDFEKFQKAAALLNKTVLDCK